MSLFGKIRGKQLAKIKYPVVERKNKINLHFSLKILNCR